MCLIWATAGWVVLSEGSQEHTLTLERPSTKGTGRGESQLCTAFFLCLPHPHHLLDTTLKEEETLNPPTSPHPTPLSWAPAKDSCGKDFSLEVRPGSN